MSSQGIPLRRRDVGVKVEKMNVVMGSFRPVRQRISWIQYNRRGFILRFGSQWLLILAIWWGISCCHEVEALTIPSPPPGGFAVPPVGLAVPPVALPPVSGIVNEEIANTITSLTQNITTMLQSKFSFCIIDADKERDETFGFNATSPFLVNCFLTSSGTMESRICTISEVKLYFANLLTVDTPPPNHNCNASFWTQACNSGWSATLSSNASLDKNLVPARFTDPQPCCAGFFCPRGLSCMIPCPLGAYCPVATFNVSTGICEPYGYQLTEGNGDTRCGGADKWGSVGDPGGSPNTFCAAGSYCPTTIVSNNCSNSHFCRQGSTTQEPCSSLTTCNKQNLQKQNLTGVGGLIIAILTVALFVLFTCSDWLMDIRQRRRTKARARAQRQARETVSGLERWKQATERAKKGATGFSRKLTTTMSRRRSPHIDRENSEEIQLYGGPTSDYMEPAASIPMMVTSIDEDGSTNGAPLDHDRFSTEMHDLYAPMPAPPIDIPDYSPHEDEEGVQKGKEGSLKGKRPTPIATLRGSQSQIFAYAYGQIEKEKVFGLKPETPRDVNHSSTVYGGGRVVGKMRPPIELSFVDLSLFLKGSGKKILSNVTGKLSPGRITAVMGPSGAGKTTFLNALAGKSTQSKTTGSVFINGKLESIQSYKSIIGFVPQDDIVHGNLTVEENLWFSASYRLPINMPTYERVLVVERIIVALGLGSIRDSRVGTVEKRGISGGQRKRVNVGLEMVMEPSLLILDEPTSGLDSTSSRLVLQALRREANVGVNVGVVLHQPSYGLFRMFDDVMFLAKGGRTVYLGPVNEVEDYFSGIGLMVPDRINPPDHYMDALEGIVVPLDQPGFDAKRLPVMWMISKGYNIPPDLADIAMELQTGEKKEKVDTKEMKQKTTFFQDFWSDIGAFLIVQKDMIASSFHRVENKSGRRTPGFFLQFFTILRRVAKQRFREARLQLIDYIILLIAGLVVGILSPMKDSNLGAGGYFYTLIAFALLVMISTLRTFSNDKLTFWRESASGINRVAYFMAKDVVDLLNVVIKPAFYLSMFYYVANPRSSFADNFTVTVVFVYCVVGIAYICAILLEPAPAQLMSVFLPILATLITAAQRQGFLLYLTYASYARYTNEAFVIANAKRYKGVWIITRCETLAGLGYRISDFYLCLIIIVVYGFVARLIALTCLFLSNRSRQK